MCKKHIYNDEIIVYNKYNSDAKAERIHNRMVTLRSGKEEDYDRTSTEIVQ